MKVGDVVRVISEDPGFVYRSIGTQGRIIEVDNVDDSVRVENDNDIFWIYKKEIELVNDTVTQARKLLEDAGYKVKYLEVHKDVVWKPGDVVDFRYTQNGTWYTFVKGASNWPGDARVNRALDKGWAKPLLQADPNNAGASIPFDPTRLV